MWALSCATLSAILQTGDIYRIFPWTTAFTGTSATSILWCYNFNGMIKCYDISCATLYIYIYTISEFSYKPVINKRIKEQFSDMQSIKPALHALKYEHNRHTPFYMFRHFLSVFIRQYLYGLKSCHSPLLTVLVSDCDSHSKHTTSTHTSTPWWWHSISAETCRRLCVYCVHISAHVR